MLHLHRLDLEKYNGVLDDFLNSAMDYLSKASVDELSQILKEFSYVMESCRAIFGKFAFRRMNTEQRRGPVNKAIFEAWSAILSKLDDEKVSKLIERRKNIIDKFVILCDDYDFQNVIRASDKGSIKTRINKINEIVTCILEDA